jgi:hypothetical protein
MGDNPTGCVGCLFICAAIYVIGFLAYYLYSIVAGEVLVIVLALVFLGCLKLLSGK